MATLINGINYSWTDLVVNIMGTPIVGITSVSYKKTRKMENNYGAGSYPISRGFSNWVPEAKIKIYLDELEVIKNLIASHDIQDIPEFDIIISFVGSNNLPVSHKIRKCRFMNNGVEVNQGDMKVEVELELLVGDIEF